MLTDRHKNDRKYDEHIMSCVQYVHLAEIINKTLIYGLTWSVLRAECSDNPAT